jgi:transcription elongation factor GreA
MDKVPMTGQGYAILENELKHRLEIERPLITQQIVDARADDADLAENAEYHAARQLQEANEARIAELEDKLARAEVIDVAKPSGTWSNWRHGHMIEEETGERKVWKIVGEPEADAKHGTISITSPLARAPIGNRKGASVEVAAPGGLKAYRIEKVRVALM